MHIRPFEIGLIAFFVLAAVAGLIVVSNFTVNNVDSNPFGSRVVIWGTFDGEQMTRTLQELAKENKAFQVVSYIQKDARTFDSDLVNAIAEGQSPDLVILPHKSLVKHRTKLQPISYETFPERTFRDAYIDGAEIFMLSDGVYGVPVAVDPLVMYWNRDLFSSNGLAEPPRTWDTLTAQTVPSITRTDTQRGVTQSAIAFGEYVNISYAKEILAMLFLQAGSTLVEESGGSYRVTLNQSLYSSGLKPGDAVLGFYTQFALSNKTLYSWNRSKESDRKEFLKGDLALYFAPGSEYRTIERDNVNLNFDIARVPQDSDATILRTYADFYAFVIPRASQNTLGAYNVALQLASPDTAQRIADMNGFAPVLRTVHGGQTGDPVKNVTYKEALIARGWLDPDPTKTESVLRRMIEQVTSGQGRVENIVNDVVSELSALF